MLYDFKGNFTTFHPQLENEFLYNKKKKKVIFIQATTSTAVRDKENVSLVIQSAGLILTIRRQILKQAYLSSQTARET